METRQWGGIHDSHSKPSKYRYAMQSFDPGFLESLPIGDQFRVLSLEANWMHHWWRAYPSYKPLHWKFEQHMFTKEWVLRSTGYGE